MEHRRVKEITQESWCKDSLLRSISHCMQAGDNFLILYPLYLNCFSHSLIFGGISDNYITVLKKTTTRTSSFCRIIYIGKSFLLCINYRRKSHQYVPVVNILIMPTSIVQFISCERR